nr:retrovirus-related Pol polyprotein from transposon TNT 1-94 [Tanacetum cinerariifolium]
CSKLVASKDKEVNQADRDSDDALVCCVEKMVEERIMDFGASFHATYCKEELERFKLRLGKVHLADDKSLDIARVRDVFLKTSFGTSWTLNDVWYIPGLKRRLIFVGQLNEEGCHVGFGDQQWKFGEVEEGLLHNVREDKETAEAVTRVAVGNNANLQVPDTPLQFGVAERLSRTFIAESTGLRVEAPKMLWADSVSMSYLIYRIPYVSIGMRIPEEEWRGKDTSLIHLKVFGCDSFVNVKDVCREAMKCTFIGNGSDEMRYIFRDTKSHQSPCGSSNTSEGSENSMSFKDSGRSDEEDSKDGAFSEKGGSENPQRAGYKRSAMDHCRYLKKVGSSSIILLLLVDDMLGAGFDMAEFNKPKWLFPLVFKMKDIYSEKQNLKFCGWAKLVRLLISEGSLSLLNILGTKSLADMFTRLVMKEKLKLCAASTGLRDN